MAVKALEKLTNSVKADKEVLKASKTLKNLAKKLAKSKGKK